MVDRAALLTSLVDDLGAEHADLDGVVVGLALDLWDEMTPAIPWTVRDQISHLAFFDEQGALAAVDPQGFLESLKAVSDADAFMNEPLEKGRSLAVSQLLAWWRDARTNMIRGFRALDPAARVPWFGPPMSPASFISARLMETWAHGQDIADAVGSERVPTKRLKHVAHLGVRARSFSYSAHGLSVPDGGVSVELVAPDGDVWRWDMGSSDSVTGSALGFCLAVTQRRHIGDTDLMITGPRAEEWMSIAQAFAGPPGDGRRPGQFTGKD